MQESLRRFKAGVFQALAHPTRIAIVEQVVTARIVAGLNLSDEPDEASTDGE